MSSPSEWDRRHVAEYPARMAAAKAELVDLQEAARLVGALNSTGTPSESADPYVSPSQESHASHSADERMTRQGERQQQVADEALNRTFARMTRVNGGAT